MLGQPLILVNLNWFNLIILINYIERLFLIALICHVYRPPCDEDEEEGPSTIVDEADVGMVFEEVLHRNYDADIDTTNAELWRSMSRIVAAFNRGELAGH